MESRTMSGRLLLVVLRSGLSISDSGMVLHILGSSRWSLFGLSIRLLATVAVCLLMLLLSRVLKE